MQVNRRDIMRYGAVGFGSLAVLAVAGCATDEAAVVSSSAASTPANTPAPATNFNFASWGMSEDTTKPILQGAIDAFANPKGVSVATSSYPYNDYLNQLILQVRGGQFSGAAQLDVSWLSSVAALGKLVDLSSFAAGRGYTASSLAAGVSNGQQLGLPWTIAAIGMVGNEEILGKAGVSSQPQTIDEFEEGLRALKGIGVIPYAASTKTAGLKDILAWMQTFGSPIVENGVAKLDAPEAVAAVTWYKKLFDEGLIAPDIDRSAARALFAQGQAAMYDDAPVGKAGVVAQSPDAQLGDKMSPMSRPVLAAGDTPRAVLWGHLVVVVDGEGSETAAEFAQWLSSDETQTVDYFEKLGLPPTTDKALASPVVKGNEFVSAFDDRITATAAASPLWVHESYAQMETVIAEQVQAVLIGQSSPADAMKFANDTVNGLM